MLDTRALEEVLEDKNPYLPGQYYSGNDELVPGKSDEFAESTVP
jgi:hypothetical protein